MEEPEKKKRKAVTVPRSLAEMKRRGYKCAIVEKWNRFANIRQDLFGFIDILCINPGFPDVGLQVTTSDHVSDRIMKIQTECSENAAIWLKSGKHRIIVHGWGKRGARGERKVWTLVEREIVLDKDELVTIAIEQEAPIGR